MCNTSDSRNTCVLCIKYVKKKGLYNSYSTVDISLYNTTGSRHLFPPGFSKIDTTRLDTLLLLYYIVVLMLLFCCNY